MNDKARELKYQLFTAAGKCLNARYKHGINSPEYKAAQVERDKVRAEFLKAVMMSGGDE